MKYLIIANGPFVSRKIILKLAENRILIALDGGSDQLAQRGILPHVILGDFDSIENIEAWGIKQGKSEPYIGKYDIKIVPALDQNLTDLVKAIRYCDQHDASQIDVLCATGNDLGHTLANIRVLRSEYKKGRPIYLHNDIQSLFYCKDETIEIRGKPLDYCSIMAFPSGKFSSTGLKYNGHDFPLEFAFSESTRNQLTQKIAVIDVTGEALIIHPPMLSAQRTKCDDDR